MSTPPWWQDLIRTSQALADRDRKAVAEWRGEPEVDEDGLPVEPSEDDVPPITVRLGNLTRAVTEDPAAMSAAERRQAFDVLERVQTTGSKEDRTAVVTGFLEALLMAADRGFDLQTVWDELGPASRASCRELNEFWGIESPGWMHSA
ncbi:DUF7674 family protein [Streptomyces rimosus]|uniref:DUF7674 family protein n=1 Tax=Streptomyces rimosus TaxID=1927 RepID=UPI0037BB1287